MSMMHDVRRDNRNGVPGVQILKPGRSHGAEMPDYALWQGDAELFLDSLPREPLLDLIVTSPPYNIGKPYETWSALKDFLLWQSRITRTITATHMDRQRSL